MFMTLNAAHTACTLFGEAVEHSTPDKWNTAANAFEATKPFAYDINASKDASYLNLATVADKKVELVAACNAMALYTDPANHSNVEKLKEMEKYNKTACDMALLDSEKIRGRRSIVECETHLKLATDAIPDVALDPEESAQETTDRYKKHASIAVHAFSKIPKDMLKSASPELPARIASTNETLKQYYAKDYQSLMQEAEAAWLAE